MRSLITSTRRRRRGRALGTVSVCLLILMTAAPGWAQQVRPPPRPPGSEKVQVEPGMNPVEQQRALRAAAQQSFARRRGQAPVMTVPVPRPLAVPGSSP